MKRFEEIQFALTCIAITYRAVAIHGDTSFEQGKETAKEHWRNKNLSISKIYEYFKEKGWMKESTDKMGISVLDEPTPEKLKAEISTEHWQSLEYFGLI